jgi:hypothetical protein
LLAAVLLGGCGSTGGAGWAKPGADEAQAAAAYRDCAALTDDATRSDAAIDQDVAASRGSDLQRASILREQAERTRADNGERADAILASCMQAKGFARNAR